MFTSLLKDMIKGADKHPDGRYRTRYVEGPESFHVLSNAPLSKHLYMSTNQEDDQTLYFGDFMEVSSCRHDQSLTSFSALLPSQENGGQG